MTIMLRYTLSLAFGAETSHGHSFHYVRSFLPHCNPAFLPDDSSPLKEAADDATTGNLRWFLAWTADEKAEE